ncbi:MAG: LamG domain-containing protein [archaeon]
MPKKPKSKTMGKAVKHRFPMLPSIGKLQQPLVKNPSFIFFLVIAIALVGLLVYFGPRILGFVTLQQQAKSITLLTGTYERTSAWNGTGLVSWWKFDEGTGNISYDSVGGNTGTIYNPNSYTKLLLHSDGADAANASGAVDSATGKTVAGSYGDAQLDTAQKEFGSASLLLDGTGDYINYTESSDWAFGTGDFTVEAWIKFKVTPSTKTDSEVLAMQKKDANNWWVIYLGDGEKISVHLYSGGVDTGEFRMTSPVSLGNTAWHHIAVVRNGASILMFIDGASQAVTTITALASDVGTTAGTLYVGKYGDAANYYFDGWIDELRISKGIARWTSDFAVRTSQYEGYEDSGDFTDVAVSGKALKFDGLGDFVNVSDSNDWNFGANPFTMDFWVKFNSLPPAGDEDYIYQQYGGGNFVFFYIVNSAGQYQWTFYTSVASPVAPRAFNTTLNTGTWYHVALTRNGNSFMVFQDGIKVDITQTIAVTLPDIPANVLFGRHTQGYFFNGTLDEVKIWNRSLSADDIWQEYKGRSGVYTNWTMRTEPYACDSNTVALWHFDDSAADVCGAHGGTINMTGTHDNFTAGKFGKALSLDGAGDFAAAPDSNDWYFGSNDFTIDLWVKFDTVAGQHYLVTQYTATNSWYFLYEADGNIYLTFINSGAKANYILAWTPSAGVWYHLAAERINTTANLFINGVQQTWTESVAFSNNDVGNLASALFIGCNFNGAGGMNGTIDEVRISNRSRTPDEFREFYRQGTYKKQFDAATSGTEWKTISWNVSRYSKFGQELAKDDSTVLLMHFNNDSSVGENYNNSNGSVINDYSDGNNNGTLHTGIANGITYSSTGGKFSGAFTFDGKNDYVSIPNSADWNFGTAKDFTIDLWAIFRDISLIKGLVVADNSAYTTGWEWIWQGVSGNLQLFEAGGAGSSNILWSPSTNTWYHLALVRSGSNSTVYVNGVRIGTYPNYNLNNDNNALIVGATGAGTDQFFNGTIDEVAIYNRSLREDEIQDHFERGDETRKVWMQTRSSANNVTWGEWTGNKEMPQPNEQITNSSTAQNGTLLSLSFDDASTKTQTIGQRGYKGYDGEKPDANTKLLLHMDGSDASTTFTDSSIYGKLVTAVGNAQLDTAQSKFGGASGLFDGTGDYLSIPDSADWAFGTGDFTIDTWVRFNVLPGAGNYPAFVGQSDGGLSDWVFSIPESGSTYKLRMAVGGSAQYGDFKMTNNWGVSTNTWYHLAFVRSGSNAYIFIDGVSQALTTDATWGIFPDSSAVLAIGGHVRDSKWLDAWMDEFRIIKGIARWTSNFAVPTQAYVADIVSSGKFLSAFNVSSFGGGTLKYPTGASADTDTVLLCRFDNSYACDTGQNGTMSADGYTKLLLHFDGGGNGTTTFLDSETTPKAVTANGQVYINTAQKKFGASSGFFDGAGDYLSLADSDDWAFGSEDFTIDFYIKWAGSVTANAGLLSHWAGPPNDDWNIYYDTNGFTFYYSANGTYPPGYFFFPWRATLNNWHHIAFVRNGNNFKLYADGIQVGSTQDMTGISLYNAATTLIIGDVPTWEVYFNGFLDEVRISKGVARWTSNFAPPTAQYPFEFETGKYGQGAKFNGNVSYLTLKDSDDWNFGSGDFTIDTWVRFNSMDGAAQTQVSQYVDDDNFWRIVHDGTSTFILQFKNGAANKGYYLASWTPVINTWYHVTWERSGSIALLFINGISITPTENTAFGSNDVGNLAANLNIGKGISAVQYMNGTLDELHITKGRARTQNEIYNDYFGNLNKTAGTIAFWTKPEGWNGNDSNPHIFYETSDADNAAFMRIGKDAGNNLFFNMNNGTDNATKLLLHFDGADASTTFTDSSPIPKTVTPNGGAQISQVSTSGLFDGDSDYLTVPDSADWNMGTGAFTVDTWVRFNSLAGNTYALWGQSNNATTSGWGLWHQHSTNTLDFVLYFGSTSLYLTVPFTSVTNNWYHIALVRVDDSNAATGWRIFIDGVSQTLTKTSGNWNAGISDISELFRVGYSVSTGLADLNGWIDEFRVSKGIARWTGNFVPQTVPYTTDSSTKLLLHMDGRDASTTFTDDTGKTVTAVGTAQIDTAQYKVNSQKFSQAAYFDGSGDYLNLSDSADWDFGSGDFTIDCWIRYNNVQTYSLLSHWGDSGNRNFEININSATVYFYYDNDGNNFQFGWSPSTNTWYHVAAVRNGNDFKFFINGIQSGVTKNAALINFGASTANLVVGRSIWDEYFNGWMDELRISKGIARWTGNFEPPKLSYPYEKIVYSDISNWSANVWQHVAATWDNTSMKLYINGTQVNSTVSSPLALNSVNLSSSMRIGSNADGRENCQCSIDDFAIYNYPKTSPKTLGYTADTGENIASTIGRYIEARAIFATKDIEKTVVLGEITITAEDLILWSTPSYEGTTLINGNSMTVTVNFSDTSNHLYDVVCNITSSGGTNMWGVYLPPSYMLSNTSMNITDTIDVSSWNEGNYSMSCKVRDI